MAELHEFCQKKKLDLHFVKDKWEETMTIEVLINDRLVGSATYGNKKDVAMNRAAKSALDRLVDLLDSTDPDLNLFKSARCNHLRRLCTRWSMRASPTFFLVSLLTTVIVQLMLMLMLIT